MPRYTVFFYCSPTLVWEDVVADSEAGAIDACTLPSHVNCDHESTWRVFTENEDEDN